MKPLKERKTPLQSKNKVRAMMILFERYIDEKNRTIDLERNVIIADKEYCVDISKNNVTRIYPDYDFD